MNPTLQAAAIFGEMANFVKHWVDELLADRIVATSVIVRSILFPRNHLLRVEKPLVWPGSDFV